MEENSKESKKFINGISLGPLIGCGIGVAIGAATENMGLWIALGLSAGLGLGAIIGKKMDDNDKRSK